MDVPCYGHRRDRGEEAMKREKGGGRSEAGKGVVSVDGTGSWQRIGMSTSFLYVYPPCALC